MSLTIKELCVDLQKTRILKNINLEIRTGEFVSLLGASGCGKTTLLKSIAGLLETQEGDIRIDDTSITNLAPEKRGTVIVFQDLRLFPHMTVEQNISFSMDLKKIPKKDKQAQVGELLKAVQLEGFEKRKIREMSGGQRQRISIARALSLEPEILVCDEATSALDVSVQESVIELLVRLQKEKNICMIFICHDLALIRSFAHQIAVMYLGHIVETIPGEDVSGNAEHPYTKALVGAQFSVHMDPAKKIESIESEAPSPLDVPVGCPFQNRCEHCTEQCKKEMPELKEIAPGHEVACFYVENITK